MYLTSLSGFDALAPAASLKPGCKCGGKCGGAAPADLGFAPAADGGGFPWWWLAAGAAAVLVAREMWGQSVPVRRRRAIRGYKKLSRGIAADKRRFDARLEALRIP